MCAAVDMLTSQQYFYGHSPPAGFLADYGLQIPSLHPQLCISRGRPASVLLRQAKTIRLKLSVTPRSILRSESDGAKKKVVFADDTGLPLEQIRFMTEPSHLPPYWIIVSDANRNESLKVPRAPHKVTDRWECCFAQPASDYLGFRTRITEDKVSLENVIIKESEGVIEGTVKVKNLDFNKTVFVRATSDGWSTHEDTFCAFSECRPCGPGVISLFDTFAFRIQLPIHSRRLDFCVCFQCQNCEYWDNNRGQNYRIEKRFAKSATLTQVCGRLNVGNSWSTRSVVAGNTPYW